MITVEGRAHIKRFMAGYVPAIGGAVALGIGTIAENASDVNLQFESTRAKVTQIFYDFAEDRVVFKTAVPGDYVGWIYEIGLFSAFEDKLAGSFGSKIITSFDSAKEQWLDTTAGTPEAFASAHARIGGDSLAQSPLASATKSSTYGNTSDYSGYSGADVLSAALYVGNTNTASVTIRFMTDSANYYSFTSTAVTTSGYKFLSFTKGSATVTGTPNWNAISEIRVSTTSSGGGVSAVEWDGLKWNDQDTDSLDHILVARKVLDTPAQKIDGQAQDIEFYLDVTLP